MARSLVLDQEGRQRFYDLLRRPWGEPVHYASDLLWLLFLFFPVFPCYSGTKCW